MELAHKRFITAQDHPSFIAPLVAGNLTEFVCRADIAMQAPDIEGVVWLNPPSDQYGLDLREQFLGCSPKDKIAANKEDDIFYNGQDGLYVILDAGEHRQDFHSDSPQSSNAIQGDIRIRFSEEDGAHEAIMACPLDLPYKEAHDKGGIQPTDFSVPNALASEISALTALFETTETQIRFEQSNGSHLHYDGEGDVPIDPDGFTLDPSAYLFNGHSVRMIRTLQTPGFNNNDVPTTQVLKPNFAVNSLSLKAESSELAGTPIFNLQANQWLIFKNLQFPKGEALFHGAENFEFEHIEHARIFLDHSFGLSTITRDDAQSLLRSLEND